MGPTDENRDEDGFFMEKVEQGVPKTLQNAPGKDLNQSPDKQKPANPCMATRIYSDIINSKFIIKFFDS